MLINGIINIILLVVGIGIVCTFFYMGDSLSKIAKELHELNENIKKNKINEDKDL